MRSPRVTYHARLKHPRFRRTPRFWTFALFVILKASLFIAPVALCGLYILWHGTPHVLWEYEYYGPEEHRTIISCEYYGWQGLHKISSAECPLIKFI